MHLRNKRYNCDLVVFGSTQSNCWRSVFRSILRGLIAVPVSLYMQGLLAKSGGIDELGILRIVTGMNSIILFVPSSIAAATISFLAEANTDKGVSRKEFVEYTMLNLKFVWIFCLIMALIFWLSMPMLIDLLFGAKYLSAVSAARLGLFVAINLTIINAASHAYFAQRKVGIIFYQTAIYSVILIAVGTIVVPQWYAFGYVFSELIGFGLVCVIIVGLILKEGKQEDINVSPLLILLALTFILCAFLVTVDQIPNQALHTSLGVGSILLATTICYKCVLSNTERSELDKWARNHVSKFM